jgi:hypothetical protein
MIFFFNSFPTCSILAGGWLSTAEPQMSTAAVEQLPSGWQKCNIKHEFFTVLDKEPRGNFFSGIFEFIHCLTFQVI